LYALYFLMTAALLALAVSRAPVVIMGALAVIGLAAALLATLWTSAVQSAVPHHHIGGATGFMRASSDLVLGATYPLVGLPDAYVEAAGAMILMLGASVAIVGAAKVPMWGARPPREDPNAAPQPGRRP
jgi:sugar phosphate permease